MNNTPKRFMVTSTEQRVEIFDALVEKYDLDRHILINALMRSWVLENLDDDDLRAPVDQIFSNNYQ